MPSKPPRLTLYTTSRCTHCKQLKQWLNKHGLRYQEFDVERNQRAYKTFARLGGRAVPVLMVGEQRIDGFDPKKLARVLKVSS